MMRVIFLRCAVWLLLSARQLTARPLAVLKVDARLWCDTCLTTQSAQNLERKSTGAVDIFKRTVKNINN
jgi:hypothetical protein